MVSAEEAVRLIQSGDRVYLHEVAMTPHELLDALVLRASELENLELVALHTEGPAPHVAPSMAKRGTVSRIVPTVQPGAGIATTRGHVQYVATEYGVVDLAGQSIRRRAELQT